MSAVQEEARPAQAGPRRAGSRRSEDHGAMVEYAKYSALVQRRLISAETLAATVEEARRGGVSVGSILVSRHRIPKQSIGSSLSAFYQCPFVEFDAARIIPKELLANISLQYLRVNGWVPLERSGNTVVVFLEDPRDPEKILDIRHVYPGCDLRFLVGLAEDVLRHIDSAGRDLSAPSEVPAVSQILGQLERDASAPVESPQDAEVLVDGNDGGVARLVNQIILDAHRALASDIHIEPYQGRETIVRFRVDGECRIYQKIPPSYSRALISRIKIMAGLDIAERRRPQDGKIALRLPDRDLELRVAVVPTAGGKEDAVLRLLASSQATPLDQLGLAEHNLPHFKTLLESPYGMILCVGPTGSGKTTTLHSALWYLNGPDVKIWTAEDPVEITQYGLRQVQVNHKIGFGFAEALRSFLRADPDVIMIGEMRDRETTEIAVQAALTGHLVLSTLHTNSAPETVTRLLDLGLDPFSCADALLGILAQRLVRTICERCKIETHPPRGIFDELARDYGEEEFSKLGCRYGDDFVLFEGKGCDACDHTGYKGRAAIHELLVATDEVKHLIQDRAPIDRLKRSAAAQGMRSLMQDGIVRCLRGSTDISQIRAAAKN